MATPRSPYAHGRSEIHERTSLVRSIRRECERLGVRLRQLRKASGMTQAEAAEAAGLHAVHVARVEAGTANVTLATLVAFGAAYKVPLVAFFESQEGGIETTRPVTPERKTPAAKSRRG